MLYQRSLEIERRLDTVLRLVRTGAYSTPKIAEKLGVSIPTISRDVTALRERGHDIQSVRENVSWRYVLPHPPASHGADAGGRTLMMAASSNGRRKVRTT